MFQGLFRVLTGPIGVIGVLLVGTPGGRKLLKRASKEAIRAGVLVSEKAKELSQEIKDETAGLISEVKEERDGKNSHEKVSS
ncbi:MAG TPA: hypothetical protein V6C72_01445 [Chroococcales cyanobacterium]